MPNIKILPDDKHIEISADETILEASLKAGIPHTHACGGNALCSTCRVVVLKGRGSVTERNEPEQKLAESLGFTENIRLACQTKVCGSITINRPVVDEIDEELINKMMVSDDATGRIGEEKKVAIVFADIVSYTPFAESLPAYDVIHVLDRYFYLIGNVIKENNGRIIDYYGDGVLAVFGIKNEESAAIDSIKASCEMFDSLEKLNPYLQRMYKRNFNIRVGLHYGSVIIGTIGIEDSRKFTAIGDAVNFASRIESANKNHGTNFLISQDAYTAVKEHIKTGKVVNEKLKGKTGSHSLYEVLGLKDS